MKWKTCYTLLIFHFLCSMLASVSSLAVWLTGKRKRRLCLGLINFSRERHEEGNQPRAAKLSDCTVKDLSQIFAGSWIGMIGIRLGRQSVTARLYSRSRQPAELLDFSFSNEPRLERDMSAQPGPSPTTSQTLPVLSFLIQSAQHSGPSNHVWNLEDYQVFCSICHLRPYMESIGEVIRITKCPDCREARRQRLEPRSRQAITSYFSVVTYWCQY